jgi:hypothetical protein
MPANEAACHSPPSGHAIMSISDQGLASWRSSTALHCKSGGRQGQAGAPGGFVGDPPVAPGWWSLAGLLRYCQGRDGQVATAVVENASPPALPITSLTYCRQPPPAAVVHSIRLPFTPLGCHSTSVKVNSTPETPAHTVHTESSKCSCRCPTISTDVAGPAQPSGTTTLATRINLRFVLRLPLHSIGSLL